jgi:hypothetical protein
MPNAHRVVPDCHGKAKAAECRDRRCTDSLRQDPAMMPDANSAPIRRYRDAERSELLTRHQQCARPTSSTELPDRRYAKRLHAGCRAAGPKRTIRPDVYDQAVHYARSPLRSGTEVLRARDTHTEPDMPSPYLRPRPPGPRMSSHQHCAARTKSSNTRAPAAEALEPTRNALTTRVRSRCPLSSHVMAEVPPDRHCSTRGNMLPVLARHTPPRPSQPAPNPRRTKAPSRAYVIPPEPTPSMPDRMRGPH